MRIAKSSVSFSGLIGQKPKGRCPGPELYLDNCTENDFEQRPVGREEIIRIWKHIRMKKLRKGTDWSQDQATKKSSYKERRVDAKAPYADEGRGKLRKAAGNCKQVMIRRYPNGGTQPE